MPEFLSSRILIQEEPPRLRSLPSLPTAVLAAVGITERGPVRVPTLVTSFDEFVNIYGGFIAAGELALQVRQFFLGGGRQAWISRVVHYDPITSSVPLSATRGDTTLNTAATAAAPAIVTGSVVGPWDLTIGAPIDLQITFGPDGVGGAAALTRTATFTAVAPFRDSAVGPFNFTGDLPANTLTVAVDGGPVQTIVFTGADFPVIGTATAAEVVTALNGRITGASASVVAGAVRITSDRRGTGGSIDVTPAGALNADLRFTVGLIFGTGNVSNLRAVQFAEVETVVEAAMNAGLPILGNDGINVVANGGRVELRNVGDDTGVGANINVLAASTTDTIFGLANGAVLGTSGAAVATLRVSGKYEGSFSGLLQVEILPATSGIASEFNLRLYRSGLLLDTFANLTMDAAAARYVQTVIGTGTVRVGVTEVIRANDLAAIGTPTQRRPANTALMPAAPTLGTGNDGLALLADTDFSGDVTGQNGLRAFDAISGIRLLICPDRATAAVQNAMTTYGEVTRGLETVTILDPPAALTAAGMVTYRATLTASEFGVSYWPRIRIPNPSVAVYGTAATIIVPVSGAVAGRMAQNDSEAREGAFRQPAGIESGALVGVVGLETDDVNREAIRDLIFPQRINPIMSLPGRGVFIDGARTLRGDSNFPSVGERRGVSDVETVIRAGVLFAKNQNNTPELRATVERTIRVYLIGKMRDGCFASTDPATAFYVDVSEALNPPSTRAQGILRVRIGLATNRPAEFIWILVTQDTRALESEALSP